MGTYKAVERDRSGISDYQCSSVGATMKLTTITVKVCSTEFNDSRSKGPVTDAGREASPESTTVCPNQSAATKVNPIQ